MAEWALVFYTLDTVSEENQMLFSVIVTRNRLMYLLLDQASLQAESEGESAQLIMRTLVISRVCCCCCCLFVCLFVCLEGQLFDYHIYHILNYRLIVFVCLFVCYCLFIVVCLLCLLFVYNLFIVVYLFTAARSFYVRHLRWRERRYSFWRELQCPRFEDLFQASVPSTDIPCLLHRHRTY